MPSIIRRCCRSPIRRSRPVPFLVVLRNQWRGPVGLFIGVRIDRFRQPNSLTGAADRFHIKGMFDKAESGNRSEPIARVLGLDSTPIASQA